MNITANMVKELREKTGAGMMECKKALVETNGDVEAAVKYLREKGIAKAAKRASKIAAEGLCDIVIKDNEAVVFELNSETDFVAKNSRFVEVLHLVGQALINNQVQTVEDAQNLVYEGKTITNHLVDATATIGEKITLRRFVRIHKNPNQIFGHYKHMGGRIASLTVVEGDHLVAKDIAMHVAASKPLFLDAASVDQKVLADEKSIITEHALNENKEAAKPKPQNVLDKIIEGRVNKYLEEITLVNQPFFKDPNIKVAQFLSSHKGHVVSFNRLEVGEGIEKEVTDFAAEVASVVGLK